MEMDIKHKVVTVRQSEWVLWMEKHLTTVLRVCNLFYPTDDYGKKELYQEILLHLWKGYGQRREGFLPPRKETRGGVKQDSASAVQGCRRRKPAKPSVNKCRK